MTDGQRGYDQLLHVSADADNKWSDVDESWSDIVVSY